MLKSSHGINLDNFKSVRRYFKWMKSARPSMIEQMLLQKEQVDKMNVNVPDDQLAKRKRCRSQNWDDIEKNLFLEYIREELDVVENKKKLTSCNRQKNGAWKRISARLEEKGYSRDAKRLKEQWQRMKLQARRNINAFKKRYNLIGAGPPPTEPTDMDWMIIDMIPNEFMDDRYEVDSDSALMPEVILDSEETNEPSTTGDIYRTHQNTPDSPELSDNEVANRCATLTSLISNADERSMSLYEEKMLRLNEERIHQQIKHEQELHQIKMEQERMITKYKEELFQLRKAHEIELHKEKLKLTQNGS